MTLPPWSYFLLIAVTVAAAPWVLRGSRGSARPFAALLLGGLVAFEAGLILLFYAKILCWPLVACGVALFGAAGARTRPALAAGVHLVPALAAGAAFQLLSPFTDFYFYFAFALPSLLLFSLVPAAARRLSLLPGWRGLVAAGGILLVPAFSPAAAFGWTFLVHYEVLQLPALLLFLLGVRLFAVPPVTAGKATEGREATVAERVGTAPGAPIMAAAPLLLVGLFFAFLALRPAPLPAAWGVVAWLCFVLSGAFGLFAWIAGLRARLQYVLVIAAAIAAFAVLLGARFGAEAFHVFLGGGPARETLYFYAAGLALLLAGLAAATGVAVFRHARSRWRLAARPEALVQPAAQAITGVPAGYGVAEVSDLPDVRALEWHRAAAQDAGERGRLLIVGVPLASPLVGLPEDVDEWLAGQRAAPYVHLAVREGRETFLVPILDAEEEA
jgi:hypothetical protein